MVELDASLDSLELEVELFNNELNVDMNGVEIQRVVYKDHSKLDHRSDDDQHPMSAITGLETALGNLEDESISNVELQDFFRSR